MRIFPALFGALLVTLAVFLFMHSLIQRGKEDGAQLVVYNDVQIVHSKPEKPPPGGAQADTERAAEPSAEPGMAPLALAAAALPAAPPAALDMPALDLAVGDLALAGAGSGDRWSAPLGGAELSRSPAVARMPRAISRLCRLTPVDPMCRWSPGKTKSMAGYWWLSR